MWFLQLIYPVVSIMALILPQIYGVLLAICFFFCLEIGEIFWQKWGRRTRTWNSLACRAKEGDSWRLRENYWHWKWRGSCNMKGERGLKRRKGQVSRTERSRGRLAGEQKTFSPERSRKGWLLKIESPKSIIKGFSCGKPVQLKRQQAWDVYYF